MFKITTVVKIGVISLLLAAVGANAAGNEGGSSSSNGYDCSGVQQQYLDAKKPGSGVAADVMNTIESTLTACKNGYGGNSPGDAPQISCDNAVQQWSTAVGDFTKACTDGQLKVDLSSMSGNVGGNVACSAAIKDCNKITDSSYAGDDKHPYDTSQTAKNNQAKCPTYDPVDLKDLQDKVKQQSDSVKALNDQLPTLVKAQNDGKQLAAKNKKDLMDEQATAAKDHTEKLRSITSQLSSDNKEIKAKFADLQSQLTTQMNAERQAQQGQFAAAATLAQARTQIRLNCFKTASDQVAMKQKVALDQMSANGAVSSGQANFLQNVGLSSRESWQKLAKVYYDWCLSSQPTLDSFIAANTNYQGSLQGIAVQVKGIDDQIASIQSQMVTTMSTAPCGSQPGAVADNCEALTKKTTAMNDENESNDKAEAASKQELLDMANDSEANQKALDLAVSKKTIEINDETTRMNNLRDYYNMKSRSAAGINPANAAAIMNKYADLNIVAASIVRQCTDQCAASAGSSSSAAPKCNGELINTVQLTTAFLKANPDYKVETSTQRNVPRTYAPSTTQPASDPTGTATPILGDGQGTKSGN